MKSLEPEGKIASVFYHFWNSSDIY